MARHTNTDPQYDNLLGQRVMATGYGKFVVGILHKRGQSYTVVPDSGRAVTFPVQAKSITVVAL